MKISAEISLYPLSEQYRDLIYDFIEDLKNSENVEIRVNGMSTQIFGEYDTVTTLIHTKMKLAFNHPEKVACIIKYMNSDRS